MSKLIIIIFNVLILVGNAFCQAERSNWFEFYSAENFTPSVIDMSDWLDVPAGKHGFLQIDGTDFKFEDGTPVKFWGVNICSARPYSEKDYAEQWARILAKYGVNAVRFHKFTYHGFKSEYSTVIDPAMFMLMDFFHDQLRRKGIYYGWSPIYGHKPRPGDAEKLLAYDEIINTDTGNHLSHSTIGLVNFAEDLQDLHIELIVNMLNHMNPYSGLRYADDPALIFVELQNEDNIWFATTQKRLELCPTYRDLLAREFSQWLKAKYKTHENMLAIWSKDEIKMMDYDWHLDKENICPIANHGMFEYEYLLAEKEGKPMPAYLSDMARFLYEKQTEFYQRFIDAIRETGYRGPVVGSCWQAGTGPTHYYNLHADYLAGIIDRHNYFGGGTGHRLTPGPVKNQAMVAAPGSGLLSTGMQQVIDRPFSFSEWMSLPPNEWIAEGPPLIAAYGMGLQGWDASFAFASDFPHYTKTIHTPGVYNVMSPTQLALYPALARMIYRNDVREGEPVSVRYVNIQDLINGKLGFKENFKQQHDFKEFTGTVPREALAIGKVAVEFSENVEETVIPDLTNYWDQSKKEITSVTAQLVWNYANKGFVTINSPGTKGFIGFSNGEPLQLGDMTIQVNSEFAVVLISSLEKEKPIQTADRLLITTIARATNTGLTYNEDKTRLLNVGTAPILMEPVNAAITINREGDAILRRLDHVGRRTNVESAVTNGQFVLDGRKSRTFYYEIEY